LITAREYDEDSDEGVSDIQLKQSELNHLDNDRVVIEDLITSIVSRKRSKARKKVLVPLLKTAAKIQKSIEVAQTPISADDSIFLPIEAAEQPESTSDDESASNGDVEAFFV
jgi:hypothetical protein